MAKGRKAATKNTAKRKPPKVTPDIGQALLAEYWQQRDPVALRIWADALIDAGDPRGEFIQMCLLEAPTDEQKALRVAHDKKHHTKLCGPARAFLREFELGANGLVERARCEADLLIAGLPLIEWLNPELALSVTSIDAKGAGLEACSLERIYHVNFAWGVIGSQSGSNMKDATLTRIAPALRRVRHLTLQCAGYADKCFTPAALRVVGETVECLEYLGFRYYDSASSEYAADGRRGIAPLADYAQVIATAPGFRNLKALFIRGLANRSMFDHMNLAHLETLEHGQPGSWKNTSAYGADYGVPATADEIEPLKNRDPGRSAPSRR